jgi:taurine dioxygenase
VVTLVSLESGLDWTPLTERFGAEVALDLTQPLTDEAKRDLTALFDERQLLVFRDQDVALEQQIALATTFCPLVLDPPVAFKDAPAAGTGRHVTNVPGETNAKGGELLFHTEFGFLQTPIYGLSLWAEELSPGGPATLFASIQSAYEELSGDLKARIADYQAVHVRPGAMPSGRDWAQIPEGAPHTTAPLVYPNPRTGQPTLFLSPLMTHSVVGLALDEGRSLLEELEELAYRPDRIYRLDWNRHDLVIWDNIAVAHARESVEVGAAPRKLRRVTIGDPARYAAV